MREKLRTTHWVDPSIKCGDKVKAPPSAPFAARSWIQLFVSKSRNQNIFINPSQITARAAKVVIVINKVKLLNANVNTTKITLYVKVTQSEISEISVHRNPGFISVTYFNYSNTALQIETRVFQTTVWHATKPRTEVFWQLGGHGRLGVDFTSAKWASSEV